MRSSLLSNAKQFTFQYVERQRNAVISLHSTPDIGLGGKAAGLRLSMK
jgi:hypothetical protein